MECPVCGEKSYPVATVRGTTTLFGAVAGGYVAATAGGQTGATIGTLLCPGVGTLIGGALGILVGAAGGAVAGNTVGKLIDENVIRSYRCGSCSYQWRV